MDPQLAEARSLFDLRARATGRLTGTAEAASVAAQAAGALAVLHSLASSPDTAADALALLHELQVHQVELDLQAEELRDSRADLEAELRRQTALFDFQPVASLSVDGQLAVREANLMGAKMLCTTRDAVSGLRLDAFLSADGTHQLLNLMSEATEVPQSLGPLAWRQPAGPDLAVCAHVGLDPSGGFFMVLMPVAKHDPS